ncbi:hypothetical protein [Arthrobacter burdickii]|uniref:Uncharacterized protein n=1 Tax=Arthrobacter burdickii TaxID=3035920 RepID=A0ABT8K0W0_9MICC|nr:hypothetical protein [Arthrobacter burdickii]MDN4611065.1 hypothetical protein [Arthrobacter burdickii]
MLLFTDSIVVSATAPIEQTQGAEMIAYVKFAARGSITGLTVSGLEDYSYDGGETFVSFEAVYPSVGAITVRGGHDSIRSAAASLDLFNAIKIECLGAQTR